MNPDIYTAANAILQALLNAPGYKLSADEYWSVAKPLGINYFDADYASQLLLDEGIVYEQSGGSYILKPLGFEVAGGDMKKYIDKLRTQKRIAWLVTKTTLYTSWIGAITGVVSLVWLLLASL